MKEISSMQFPQHGAVFYFYGQALSNTRSIDDYITTLIE
jgi:hypothetical protein